MEIVNTIDENVLKILKNQTMGKRIKREIEELIHLYNIVKVDYTNNGEIRLILNKKHDKMCTSFCFVFSSDFPFKPPTITINDKSYFYYLKIESIRFNKVLKYFRDINCLCCHSFLCTHQWSPGYRLRNILNEFEEFKELKFNIARKILSDKIKEKYLVMDIDLDSWLFEIKALNPLYM